MEVSERRSLAPYGILTTARPIAYSIPTPLSLAYQSLCFPAMHTLDLRSCGSPKPTKLSTGR